MRRPRRVALLAVALLAPALAGCLPPPDQPAEAGRFGRFVGLAGRSGCAGHDTLRVTGGLDRLTAGRAPGEAARVRSYAALGADEAWDNQIEICAEVCAQTCMTASVAQALGGPTPPGVEPCLVSERDLRLTEGRSIDPGQ